MTSGLSKSRLVDTFDLKKNRKEKKSWLIPFAGSKKCYSHLSYALPQ